MARLNIEEVPIVVVFLDTAFDGQSPEDRQRLYADLEASAARADLPGDVVAVWQDAHKRTRFLAPPQQHPFFEVVNYAQLRAQLTGNRLAVESDKKG